MSITVNCSIDLTEEELLFILRRRAGQIIIVSPPETEKLVPEADKLVPEADKLVPETEKLVPEPVSALPIIDEDYPATEGIPPPRLPKAPRRAKTNGAEAPINATPLAPSPPPPEILDEPAMRSLLSKVGAVHPLKVKAITNILETCGGARRLSECDPATWPAIAEAAHALLAEYGA
jgi:hypothetical protein